MKPLTTSIYTFSKLIGADCLYVDKTAQIHELLQVAGAQYFLSRPRRFGKSLLISTLKAIFQGRRDLFEGLFLADSDYDWKSYPVIHLDMGSCVADSADGLRQNLEYLVEDQAKANRTALSRSGAVEQFKELVTILRERDGPVVILVDEYDKPLLGQLGAPEVRKIQSLLKTFYGVIKTTEPYQRFALITGVSKFTKVSIFSDLNNLTDLTMDPRAATLLGYTQDEVERCFPDYIERLADTIGRSREETLDELRVWYNGYRFHYRAESVYNPVSVMKCLDTQEFRNFWFETGTPTFLVDMLRENPVDIGDLNVPDSAFSSYDPGHLQSLPLLVQTGYLTMLDSSRQGRATFYKLGFPNFEIEESFSYCLAQGFTNLPPEEVSGGLRRLTTALREDRIEDMLDNLKIFFAKVPHTITLDNEKYYQTIFFTVFTLIGAVIEAEVSTNIGRVDAVIKTDTDIYLFEFKLRGGAEEALEQMRAKRYFEPYLDDGRRLTLVGAAFERETRNLGEHRIERLDQGLVREPPAEYGSNSERSANRIQEIVRRLKARGLTDAEIGDITG